MVTWPQFMVCFPPLGSWHLTLSFQKKLPHNKQWVHFRTTKKGCKIGSVRWWHILQALTTFHQNCQLNFCHCKSRTICTVLMIMLDSHFFLRATSVKKSTGILVTGIIRRIHSRNQTSPTTSCVEVHLLLQTYKGTQFWLSSFSSQYYHPCSI